MIITFTTYFFRAVGRRCAALSSELLNTLDPEKLDISSNEPNFQYLVLFILVCHYFEQLDLLEEFGMASASWRSDKNVLNVHLNALLQFFKGWNLFYSFIFINDKKLAVLIFYLDVCNISIIALFQNNAPDSLFIFKWSSHNKVISFCKS